jgi:hypothetical protein
MSIVNRRNVCVTHVQWNLLAGRRRTSDTISCRVRHGRVIDLKQTENIERYDRVRVSAARALGQHEQTTISSSDEPHSYTHVRVTCQTIRC